MTCPVYVDGSTLMHIEKAEVLRLRAVEKAARAVVEYEWGDPRKGLGPPPHQTAWHELSAALKGGTDR